MDRLHLILQRYFGHTAFKPYQREIIQDLEGATSSRALATEGQSLCYRSRAIGNGRRS